MGSESVGCIFSSYANKNEIFGYLSHIYYIVLTTVLHKVGGSHGSDRE
jgi:hypothetical protein